MLTPLGSDQANVTITLASTALPFPAKELLTLFLRK